MDLPDMDVYLPLLWSRQDGDGSTAFVPVQLPRQA